MLHDNKSGAQQKRKKEVNLECSSILLNSKLVEIALELGKRTFEGITSAGEFSEIPRGCQESLCTSDSRGLASKSFWTGSESRVKESRVISALALNLDESSPYWGCRRAASIT